MKGKETVETREKGCRKETRERDCRKETREKGCRNPGKRLYPYLFKRLGILFTVKRISVKIQRL